MDEEDNGIAIDCPDCLGMGRELRDGERVSWWAERCVPCEGSGLIVL